MSYQQEKFKEIADVIREKTGTNALIKPSEFAEKLSTIFDGEGRERWEAHIENLGNRWEYGFAGRGWNDTTFTPYTDIALTEKRSIYGLFSYSGITDMKSIFERYGTTMDLTNCNNAQNMFAYSLVTHVPKLILSSATSLQSGFLRCPNLVSIEELSIPNVTNATNAFSSCTRLREIRISGQISVSLNFNECPLSRESIESIVAALSDTVVRSVTFDKETVEAINGETDWWTELKAQKPNWSFYLS